jgi:SAM-dependent methyltransferase
MKSFTNLSGDSWLQGRQLLAILKRHGATEVGTVLDLGCGHSPFREFFSGASRYVRMDRYAVDPDVLVIADVKDLPLATGTVDTIIASRMLGDLPDIVGTLRELHRVLGPSGKILVYEGMTYPQHDLPHDYWRVLPEGLRWSAGKVGLQMMELEHLGGYFTQLGMHWNIFVIGDLGGWRLTRPVARLLRAGGNLAFAALDAMRPRPVLASDYFACLVKRRPTPGATDGEIG